MAGSFADFLENALLNLAFGGTSYTAATKVYFGLSTSTPTDAGGNITEPTDASYDMVEVDNDKTTFATSTAGTLHNDIAITFPTFTSASALVTHWFIKDDTSPTKNVLCWGSLTNPKTIDIGDTASFAIGDCVITLD